MTVDLPTSRLYDLSSYAFGYSGNATGKLTGLSLWESISWFLFGVLVVIGMEVKRVGVLGAGLMGHGIAQVCAQTGKFDVAMRDIEQRFVDNGMKMIGDSLQRFVKKGTMSENESKDILNRIRPTLDLKEAVQSADLVI